MWRWKFGRETLIFRDQDSASFACWHELFYAGDATAVVHFNFMKTRTTQHGVPMPVSGLHGD